MIKCMHSRQVSVTKREREKTMSATQPIKNKNDLTRFRNYYKEEELKPRNYALIVMGLNSALRIGDILSLRWEDVRRESAYRRHIWIRERKDGER